MKLKLITFFTVINLQTKITTANFETIKNNFANLAHNKSLTRTFGGFRTFASEWADDFISSINQYGCWCYFDDDHGKGRAQPINPVDALCKTLQHGYSCVLMDSEAEGNFECIPWDVSYNSATALGISGTGQDSEFDDVQRVQGFDFPVKNYSEKSKHDNFLR